MADFYHNGEKIARIRTYCSSIPNYFISRLSACLSCSFTLCIQPSHYGRVRPFLSLLTSLSISASLWTASLPTRTSVRGSICAPRRAKQQLCLVASGERSHSPHAHISVYCLPPAAVALDEVSIRCYRSFSLFSTSGIVSLVFAQHISYQWL